MDMSCSLFSLQSRRRGPFALLICVCMVPLFLVHNVYFKYTGGVWRNSDIILIKRTKEVDEKSLREITVIQESERSITPSRRKTTKSVHKNLIDEKRLRVKRRLERSKKPKQKHQKKTQLHAHKKFIDEKRLLVTKQLERSKNPSQRKTQLHAHTNFAAQRPVIEDIKPPPWHKPVDLRIISMVFNRATSLKRQLDYLNTAEYYGDNVLVEIWIDRSKKDGKIDPDTYTVAKNFTFKYGDVRVHNHTRHVGLYGQWMGTWKPDPDSKEIAVFLEDDVSVSPLFYRWLKNVHRKYDRRKDIAGYNLRGTCPRWKGHRGNLRAPETEFCMLYRATGSWGMSPQRDNWFKFIEWYKEASRDLTFQPLIDGIIPSDGYRIFIKRGTTDNMWTMWHIYYTHHHNQFSLFLNFPNKMGLTSHWQEAGLHYI